MAEGGGKDEKADVGRKTGFGSMENESASAPEEREWGEGEGEATCPVAIGSGGA